jgi:hypothetical protein
VFPLATYPLLWCAYLFLTETHYFCLSKLHDTHGETHSTVLVQYLLDTLELSLSQFSTRLLGGNIYYHNNLTFTHFLFHTLLGILTLLSLLSFDNLRTQLETISGI